MHPEADDKLDETDDSDFDSRDSTGDYGEECYE